MQDRREDKARVTLRLPVKILEKLDLIAEERGYKDRTRFIAEILNSVCEGEDIVSNSKLKEELKQSEKNQQQNYTELTAMISMLGRLLVADKVDEAKIKDISEDTVLELRFYGNRPVTLGTFTKLLKNTANENSNSEQPARKMWFAYSDDLEQAKAEWKKNPEHIATGFYQVLTQKDFTKEDYEAGRVQSVPHKRYGVKIM